MLRPAANALAAAVWLALAVVRHAGPWIAWYGILNRERNEVRRNESCDATRCDANVAAQ